MDNIDQVVMFKNTLNYFYFQVLRTTFVQSSWHFKLIKNIFSRVFARKGLKIKNLMKVFKHDRWHLESIPLIYKSLCIKLKSIPLIYKSLYIKFKSLFTFSEFCFLRFRDVSKEGKFSGPQHGHGSLAEVQGVTDLDFEVTRDRRPPEKVSKMFLMGARRVRWTMKSLLFNCGLDATTQVGHFSPPLPSFWALHLMHRPLS